MRLGKGSRIGFLNMRSEYKSYSSTRLPADPYQDILPTKSVTAVGLPCHSARPVTYRRWHQSHRSCVGGLGVRDGTILRVHQTKHCAKPKTCPCEHRQSDPRNDPTGDGKDEVWAHEEAFP